MKTTPPIHLRARARGFTLVELVVSAAIMSMILAAAYVCFSSAISSQQLVDARADVTQNARVAMALMTADLRAACPLSKEIQFLGMDRMLGEAEADNLDFATHHYSPRRAGEGDFCAVSYFLARDQESGTLSLFRRRNPVIAPDPLSGGRQEEIARDVRGLRFEYFDGFDWYDEWGDVEGRGKAQGSWRTQPNLSGLPEAVRITLQLESDRRGSAKLPSEKPEEIGEARLVFQTVVRLNLAPMSLIGASTGSSTSDTSQTGGQPGQAAPARGRQ